MTKNVCIAGKCISVIYETLDRIFVYSSQNAV